MKLDAVLHIPMSEYCCGLDERHIVYRLRCARGDLQRVTLFYADTACRVNPILFTSVPMEKVLSDACHDYWQVIVDSPYNRVYYYFQLDDGAETTLYYSNLFTDRLAQDRSEYFKLPFNHRSDIARVPAWVKDAVVYNIFPDSFADGFRTLSGGSDGKTGLGGTIRGIAENLDYIASMGFNCIYLNPIFAAESYHRYDTLDYYQVDPHMGSKEDVRALVEKAHSLGIRVLLDGVFNHISSRHFLFQDVLRNGMESKYYSCFYQLPAKPKLPAPGELPEYTCFSYVASMPKTNTADPYLRQYFCDVGVYWIREFDIDGWRLDVANELDDGFLRAFRTAVKAAKPDAVIVGEVWENAAHYLNGDMMDSAMNYDFRRYCRRFFAEETVDAETFDTNVSTLLLRYRENALFAQLNLLDSHDVSRYLSLCGENIDKMELSVLLQMTFPGMPCVFYGDEKGLCGLSESEYRQAMAWGKHHPLEDVYRRLIALRKEHPTLRYGDFVTNFAAGKTYSYSRNWENTRITVTMNLGGAPIPAPQTGRLLLKKGGNHDIIGAWEYEVREEQIHGGDDL